MSKRAIPDTTRRAQARASDPDISTFVSANAGSGKTHVLVSRVIRLMLSGVAPEKILCITFTKAAAANMSDRVFRTLGQWVRLDDAALIEAIATTGAELSASEARASALRRARELFARALETPGGLKVQTIHALCTRLLQQFPFEAHVPARFAVMEERDQNDILQRAMMDVLLRAAADPDSVTGEALRLAMEQSADSTFQSIVLDAVRQRKASSGWIEGADGLEHAMMELAATLEVDVQDSMAAIEDEVIKAAIIPPSEWPSYIETLNSGSANDKKAAGRLRQASLASAALRASLYEDVFLTQGGKPRARMVTKAIADAYPRIAENLEAEKLRIAGLISRRNALRTYLRTRAMLIITDAVLSYYESEKKARGLLDYDDLIEKTLKLLQSGSAQWVHYKLDRGIDHVLVDEAQDTSPAQWDIIRRLTAEFYSGAGAREGTRRTLFAVGDEKQSIFSFQGAAPKEFRQQKTFFHHHFRDANLPWDNDVRLNTSFRSGASILRAVDCVFEAESMYASIHDATLGAPLHEWLPDAAPAMIDIWEPEVPDERPERKGWLAPLDTLTSASPVVRLARRIAAEIRALLQSNIETGPPNARHNLRAGDVIVLVRKRGALFEAVIQALKQARVPVAGADRLKLTQHIAVLDLMMLADAILLAQDDLALACALKSPLFGLNDDHLMALAINRTGTLRDALLGAPHGDPVIVQAARRFKSCSERAAQDTVFGFYAWLLGGDGGRARILQRLDTEANDALDEFLDLALVYERKGASSLQGFMAWLRAADTEIKRDMELSRDEVRVMTVHGAKGLEAPIVVLADTAGKAGGRSAARLIKVSRGNGAPNDDGLLVWAGKKDDDPAALAEARNNMDKETEDEHRRLLYVAMTRAADRLIVGCALPAREKEAKDGSWYRLIRDALEASSDLVKSSPHSEFGVTHRYEKPLAHTPPQKAEGDDTAPEQDNPPPRQSAPPFLRQSAKQEMPARILMRPSDLHDDAQPYERSAESAQLRQRAILRGTLIHRLLQALPNIAPDKRRLAAERFLARQAADLTQAARDALKDQVLALMLDARFADVFAPSSRAEVSITGIVKRDGRPDALVSGQIDRLCVTKDEILIIDYKTNHNPPRAGEKQPDAYCRQLALYRHVLAKIYPGRLVRAALLWTETPEIIELSDEELSPALANIISA